MDVSLRQRPPGAVRPAPLLRVFDSASLLLHEDPDPGRVARLRDALRSEGVLRNPPIAAPMAGGRAAVLDGANRVTALRDLGVRLIVTQVVPYNRAEVALSTWRHYVSEDASPPLRERLGTVGDLAAAAVDDPAEAERRLERREGVAALIDARGVLLFTNGQDPVDAAEALNRLVGVYRGRSRIHRVDGGDLDALRAEYGPGTLIVFPPFKKADILRIAERGGRLPTGITRHIVPGRALRLNVPLAWLTGPAGVDAVQTRLDAALRQRWLDHGVRYYAEPTFLFDE